jgi:hypothetical protein
LVDGTFWFQKDNAYMPRGNCAHKARTQRLHVDKRHSEFAEKGATHCLAFRKKNKKHEEANLRSELAAMEHEWNRLTEELRCVGPSMGDLRGRLADIQDSVAGEANDDDDDDDANGDQYDDGENQRHARARHG